MWLVWLLQNILGCEPPKDNPFHAFVAYAAAVAIVDKGGDYIDRAEFAVLEM